MAIGENIGYSAKITQNNTGEFPIGFGGGSIHIALMGDPTLNMYPKRAVKNFRAESLYNNITLVWSPLEGADGYYLYRRKVGENTYELLSEKPSGYYLLQFMCAIR